MAQFHRAGGSTLLDLPDPILQAVFSYLDSRSRVSLRWACRHLNSNAFVVCFTRLTCDWNPIRPVVTWPPATLPLVETLVLVGPRDRGSQAAVEVKKFILDACEAEGAQVFTRVTHLQLKGWCVTEFPGEDGEQDLLQVLAHALPSLTHLTLHNCDVCGALYTRAAKHLTQLISLDVHCAYPESGPHHEPLFSPPPEMSQLVQLTSLSLLTPQTVPISHTYIYLFSFFLADVASLAALVHLQQLELALPVAELRGLDVVGMACTQLTQLKIVCISNEVPRGMDVPYYNNDYSPDIISGWELQWPYLVEAHVQAPSDMLLQLQLHTWVTAPSLQRLHLHVVHTSSSNRRTQEASTDAIDALSNCGALQQPLVVTPTADSLVGALEGLAPLAGTLEQLVLHRVSLRPSDTPQRVQRALATLPRLTSITLAAAVGPVDAEVVGALLAAPGMSRVIIGLGVEDRAEHVAAWADTLHKLLQAPYGQARGQGQQQQQQQQRLPAPAGQAAAQRTRPGATAVATPGRAVAIAGPSTATNTIPTTAATTVPATASTPPTATPRITAATPHTSAPGGSVPAAHAAPPQARAVRVYFGMWCPASHVDHGAVEHNPHYLRLRQLADQSSGHNAPGGFRLLECEGCSARDTAVGAGAAWLEPCFDRLVESWEDHAQWVLQGQLGGQSLAAYDSETYVDPDAESDSSSESDAESDSDSESD